MKKFLIFICIYSVAVSAIKLFIPNDVPSDISDIYNYCRNNGYSTEYCFLTDFSKPSGIKRFYINSFKEKKIIQKSLCANGRGKDWNIFNSTFSNVIGSNYSSLGKYKVGKLRPIMSSSLYGKGYNLHGLDSTNSNTIVRGILIHKGNVEFETFPLPCIPASKGCFAVSSSMMKHIGDIKGQSSKPILLYAYK
ncbi:MAG: murein L,D-transpeptidase catalytic domain family protein [Bacteroidaceae bacterium]|nr:murein L,D-transpeptidase catalytic domain family protein [Bacteroidaceae bacterium]